MKSTIIGTLHHSHFPHHLLYLFQRHIQHARDVEGRDDLHASRLAFHANQILDVLFQIAEAVGERLCSRRSLLLALHHLGLKGIQRLATVLTKPSVLRLEDDRRFQDLYRVPRPLRHHTTVATSGGVKQDAVHLVALIVIDHLHQLPTQEENILRALRMTVDRHNRPLQRHIQHTEESAEVVSVKNHASIPSFAFPSTAPASRFHPRHTLHP